MTTPTRSSIAETIRAPSEAAAPDQSHHYIALLGFAYHCSSHNAYHARCLGQQLAEAKLGLAVGNNSGTFACALIANQQAGGHSLSLLETGMSSITLATRWLPNQLLKHQQIANLASAAVIIGGSEGTRRLALAFLQRNKTVVAIEGSGGLLDEALDERITLVSDCESALSLCRQSFRFL